MFPAIRSHLRSDCRVIGWKNNPSPRMQYNSSRESLHTFICHRNPGVDQRYIYIYITGWWFEIFSIFIPKIGEDDPVWQAYFFRWVGSTTNQMNKDVSPDEKFNDFPASHVNFQGCTTSFSCLIPPPTNFWVTLNGPEVLEIKDCHPRIFSLRTISWD